jgi:hypothetical protein
MNLGPTIVGPPVQPSYDGPLNVLIALQGHAQGAVEVERTKTAYDDATKPVPTVPTPKALDDDDEE